MVIDDALASIGRKRFNVNRVTRGTVAGVLIAAYDFAIGSLENILKKHPRVPKIRFDFVDDGTLNAGAFLYKNEYFIFINTGAIGLFSLFFTRVLADGRLCKTIGRPVNEKSNLPLLGALAPDASKLNEAFSKLVVPVDQERVDYSFGLIMHAFGFLFSHELAHVMNGHVALLNCKNHIAYSELNACDAGFPDAQADRQALEMDADSAAVFQQLHQLFFKVADKAELDPTVRTDTYLNPREALFFCFFAVTSVFRFFGDQKFTLLVRGLN